MNLLLLSLLPVALVLYYIYRRDKHKEPTGKLVKAFLSGIVPCLIIPIIGLTEIHTNSPFINAFWTAFVCAGIPEEGLKLLMLYLLLRKSDDFDEPFDGIVYAVFVSMGFAAFENVMYVFSYGAQTGIARAFTAVPAHGLFGVAMGYNLAKAKFEPQHRRKYLWLSFLVPMVLHGIYDLLLMWRNELDNINETGFTVLLTLGFWIFFVLLWKRSFKRINLLAEDSVFTENTDETAAKSLTNELLLREKANLEIALPEALVSYQPGGLLQASLVIKQHYEWNLRLIYARNFNGNSTHMRVYLLAPRLSTLRRTPLSSDVKLDRNGRYYLQPNSDELMLTGVQVLKDAVAWIKEYENYC